MALFLTRRTYFAADGTFTNNLASLTRPVFLKRDNNGKWAGGIISQSDWLDQVAHRANGNGVVVYVHGFNTDQPSMLERLEKIEDGLAGTGFAGCVVAFDWPSKGDIGAYETDCDTAEDVAPVLVPDVIDLLRARLPGQNIHLLCHSMGCLLTLRALEKLSDVQGQDARLLDQVCFVAGDVEAEEMRKGTGASMAIERRCRRLTNYYSVADLTLALAGGWIIKGGKRVGQIGMHDLHPGNAVDLYTTAQFRKHVSVSDQQDHVKSHNWYYENDGFWRDVKLTLEGTAALQMPTRVPTNLSDWALLT